MKCTLLVTALLVAPMVFAKGNNETTERKPASLENELVDSYIKTADILASARKENKVCDVEAYQSSIISTVIKARGLSAFKPKMLTPNIRAALAGTLFLKEVDGANLNSDSSVAVFEKALENAYFEAPGSGVYGPGQTFVLKAKGVIEFTNLSILDDAPWIKYTKSTGQWGVQTKVEKGLPIVRVWFTVGGKTVTYRLERSDNRFDNGWILKTKDSKIDPDSNQYNIRFYNGIVSDCEA